MVELVLRAPQALVDAVSDALIDDCGALSVAVEDADAGSDDEHALFGEPGEPAPAAGWQRSMLTALFDDAASAERAAAALHTADWAVGVERVAVAEVADRDWVRATQSQFAPVAVTDDVWIVPSWHDAPEGARIAIRLDPGLAFGTGTHPTTRMCLRWLVRRAAAVPAAAAQQRAADDRERTAAAGPWRVLDYGCGSGILAIAAARLGAATVDAVDIDPAAVDATRANAARNGVALRRVGGPDVAGGGYDVVVANILAKPLELLAPLLAGHVAPGGDLVVAGLLARQADALAAVYAPWLPLAVVDDDDGWVLMAGRRPGDGAAGVAADAAAAEASAVGVSAAAAEGGVTAAAVADADAASRRGER